MFSLSQRNQIKSNYLDNQYNQSTLGQSQNIIDLQGPDQVEAEV